MQDRIGDIEKIAPHTHKFALQKIRATGPSNNSAARDHSLQYIVAVGLIFGDITGASYEDEFAADPRINQLRNKIKVLNANKGRLNGHPAISPDEPGGGNDGFVVGGQG